MIKDLRKKTDLELGDLISKLKVQLLEMRFKMANGQVNEVHKISGIKKTIAMAMTVLSERNIKVSFSTHSIQLIKDNKGKQEIKAIKISSLATEEPKVAKKTTTNNQVKKEVEKPQPKSSSTSKKTSSTANSSIAKKPTAKTSTNSNLKNSSKKQSVQIRRSAKG